MFSILWRTVKEAGPTWSARSSFIAPAHRQGFVKTKQTQAYQDPGLLTAQPDFSKFYLKLQMPPVNSCSEQGPGCGEVVFRSRGLRRGFTGRAPRKGSLEVNRVPLNNDFAALCREFIARTAVKVP